MWMGGCLGFNVVTIMWSGCILMDNVFDINELCIEYLMLMLTQGGLSYCRLIQFHL